MNPLVSVCIIHYGAIDYLYRVIGSVKASSYRDIELIVIDNNGASQAPLSPRALGLSDTRHQYLRNLENKGFAEACNQGIRLGTGKYIFILNNDIEIHSDCIRILVEAAERDPQVAILQPKMLDFHERNTFHSSAAGGFLDMFGYPFARGRIFEHAELDTGQYDNPVEIAWASGAALFARRSSLIEGGWFDRDFFMYMEEIDLAWRVRLQGYKVVYIPGTAIYHIGCPHLSRENEMRMYFNHRNSLVMLLKNLSLLNLVLILPVRLCLDLAALVSSLLLLKMTRVRAVMRAFAYIITNIGMIRNKRQAVQNARKVSDASIFSLIYRGSVVLDYYGMKNRSAAQLRRMNIKEYMTSK